MIFVFLWQHLFTCGIQVVNSLLKRLLTWRGSLSLPAETLLPHTGFIQSQSGSSPGRILDGQGTDQTWWHGGWKVTWMMGRILSCICCCSSCIPTGNSIRWGGGRDVLSPPPQKSLYFVEKRNGALSSFFALGSDSSSLWLLYFPSVTSGGLMDNVSHKKPILLQLKPMGRHFHLRVLSNCLFFWNLPSTRAC